MNFGENGTWGGENAPAGARSRGCTLGRCCHPCCGCGKGKVAGAFGLMREETSIRPGGQEERINVTWLSDF